jgi:hypothetical protein
MLVGYKARQAATGIESLKTNETVVVGKIVFDPPMPLNKQVLTDIGSDVYRNMMWFICKDELKKPEDKNLWPISPEFEGKIEASMGETFFVASPNKPFYIIAGLIYMEIYSVSNGRSTTTYYNSAIFPGSFLIDIKPGDKAVYIGTIKYHRDNFYNLTRVEIIDEYDHEMAQFRRRFGTMKLRKALIRQPREDAVFKLGRPY